MYVISFLLLWFFLLIFNAVINFLMLLSICILLLQHTVCYRGIQGPKFVMICKIVDILKRSKSLASD